jgi:hypothetical protein
MRKVHHLEGRVELLGNVPHGDVVSVLNRGQVKSIDSHFRIIMPISPNSRNFETTCNRILFDASMLRFLGVEQTVLDYV